MHLKKKKKSHQDIGNGSWSSDARQYISLYYFRIKSKNESLHFKNNSEQNLIHTYILILYYFPIYKNVPVLLIVFHLLGK